MRETDILGLADRLYPSLSGGERQRVHLARALAQIWPEAGSAGEPHGACCLMLDEPTNNLDLAHQHAVLGFARRLAERGIGVLAVLHDPNLASLYADRIFVLSGGSVIAEGAPETVLTPALFQETFGIEARIMRHPSLGYPYMVPG